MKKIIGLILPTAMILTLAPSMALADIPMSNSHLIDKCVEIANLDQFPDMVLVGYVTGPELGETTNKYNAFQIENNKCLDKGYKFNSLDVYWITKDKFNLIDLKNLNTKEETINNGSSTGSEIIPVDLSLLSKELETDNLTFDWVDNSDTSLKKETVDYSISQSSDGIYTFYKSKQTSEYNNGTPAKVETFSNPEIYPIPPTPSPIGVLKNKTLKLGMRNDSDVKILQIYLNMMQKTTLAVDGNFGPKTKLAVVAFQKSKGLNPDGVAGSKTIEIMNQVFQ